MMTNKLMNGRVTASRTTGTWIVLTAAVFALICPGPVTAGTLETDNSFLRAEFDVLGSGISGSWRSVDLNPYLVYGQIGGEGLTQKNEVGAASGVPEDEEEDTGPSNTGEKIKAGALSAIFPGAGQFYNDQRKKAYIMGGIEVAIWTAYFVFDTQGDNRLETSIEYAGIYAGTSGSHPNSYWQSVGRYMDSTNYDEARRREARALGEDYTAITSSDPWLWVNEDRRDGFQNLRADANSAYDRRDFMILFAVVNRAVSVVDAVLGVGKANGKLDTEVMGMNLELEMLPSLRNPGAQCVISRRF